MLNNTMTKLFVGLVAFLGFGLCAASARDISVNINIYKFVFIRSVGTRSNRSALESEYWYKSGGQWHSFSVDGNRASISYTGSDRLTLFKKIGKDEKDDKSFSPLQEVILPSSARDIFLLMIERNGSAEFFPMNVSPDRMPRGKIAVMNLTARALGVMFDKEMGGLKRGSHHIFTPSKKTGDNPIPIQIATRVDGKWEVIYKNRVRCEKSKRNILLIYDTSTNSKLPQFNVRTVEY